MRRRLSLPAALLAAASLALAAAVGCTTILGIDYDYEGTGTGGKSTTTSSSTGDASACGSYVWDAEASCQACMETSCCSELLACTAGTPCGTLADCVAKCMLSDEACLGACVTADVNQHQSSGADALYALGSCFGSSCQGGTQCVFPVCNANFTWSTRACATCLGGDMGCCAAFTACSNDAVCSACFQNAASQGCSVNTNYQTAYACVAGTCGPVCAEYICDSTEFGFTSPKCNYCLSQATGGCCMAFDNCAAVETSTCYQCLASASATGCDTDMLYSAYSACYTDSCGVDCAGFM
jgi:hypothetical protein